MLRKIYASTGIVPYGNKKRFYISMETARPVEKNVNAFTIIPKLEGSVCFYSVTETIRGTLLIFSDPAQTVYYWLNGRAGRYRYVVNKPVRSFEEGWRKLFETLEYELDSNVKVANSVKFYRAVVHMKADIPTSIL